ncbi:MAG: lytic transglycosylase domain-containing protein [Verrucomicrobia bacterium]|nr:lytic transglycosylase domain-containing protein [Verrucomicrobiota bacterium]
MVRIRSTSARVGGILALALALGAFGAPAFVYVRWLVREHRYNQLIEQIAPRYGVDKFLVKAVMRQESGFDPFARSKSGAIGLMQIMPETGRLIGMADAQLWNERTNIEAGAWLLAHALAYWRQQPLDDPVPFALAEYNAGRGTVLRWAPQGRPQTAAGFLANLPNRGVRHYIKRVLEYREEYQHAGRL